LKGKPKLDNEIPPAQDHAPCSFCSSTFWFYFTWRFWSKSATHGSDYSPFSSQTVKKV